MGAVTLSLRGKDRSLQYRETCHKNEKTDKPLTEPLVLRRGEELGPDLVGQLGQDSVHGAGLELEVLKRVTRSDGFKTTEIFVCDPKRGKY